MFNEKKLKKRIKEGRGSDSLEAFAQKINVSRQTLSKWEQGTSSPAISDIYRMCEYFQCDPGYLLGEYDCKTRPQTDIQAETGLSAPSIQCLLRINQKKQTVIGSAKLMLLNAILEDDQFLERAVNALYALHMVPDSAIVEISFHDENGNHTGQSFYSDSSNDLKRLYLADLQNIIFNFLESQFQK